MDTGDDALWDCWGRGAKDSGLSRVMRRTTSLRLLSKTAFGR